MNLRSALLLVAAVVAVNHSTVVLAQSSATPVTTAPAAYGATPAGAGAATAAPHVYGAATPAATTGKPASVAPLSTSAVLATTTAKPMSSSSTPAPAVTTAKPAAPASTTAKPASATTGYGAAKPASTTVKPATAKTGYGAATTKTPKLRGCFDVSVEGDATYCIAGPLCSGAGSKPTGTNCPKAGDAAVRHCLKTLKSYVSADKCVAPVNAVCKKIKTGAWGCVWDIATKTKPSAPAAYGAAKPSATTVKPANASATAAPHVYGAKTPATTTAKTVTTKPVTTAPPVSTTRAPSATTAAPVATTAKPATATATTTAANQQSTPASTTVAPEYVVAYKSFSVEGDATNGSDGGADTTFIGLGAVGVAAAVTATVVYQRKKRQTKKNDANMEGAHVKIVTPVM